MMKKYICTRTLIKAAAFAAVCSFVAVAQQDWFAGDPVPVEQPAPVQAAPAPAVQQPQPARPPQPAAVAEQPAHAPAGPAAQVAESVPPPPPSLIVAESDIPSGTEISSRALASAPYLHFDRESRPGEGKVMRPKDRTVYQQFDRVMVKPTGKKKFAYKAGDTLDLVNRVRWISFKGRPALLTARVGRGVVVGYAGDRMVLSLNEIWGVVDGGESVAEVTHFEPFRCENLTTSDWGTIKATVVMRVEETVLPYLHQYIIIDKGSDSGVRLGDFFKVMEKPAKNRLSEPLLEAQVINVSPSSATLVVQKLHKNSVSPGDHAFLSFRSEAK